ncbi:hypothetical protein [Streptomyces sp. S1D4-14]|nr:hypothetical protein [Streptomyces sp. S1D4-14]
MQLSFLLAAIGGVLVFIAGLLVSHAMRQAITSSAGQPLGRTTRP